MTPKQFASLALAAVAMLTLALTVYSASKPWSQAKAGGRMFANLNQDAAAKVQTIEFSQGKSKLTLEKSGERWLMREKNDFPASVDKVRTLLVNVMAAELAEAKTNREAGQKALELENPADDAANSYLMRLKDATGAVMAEIVVGKSRAEAFGAGKAGTYVRRPSESQTWLANRQITAGVKLANWARERLFEAKAEKFSLVTVEIDGEPSYDIKRDPEGRTFSLANIPAGQKQKFANMADDIVDILTSFNLDESRKVDSAALKGTPFGTIRAEIDPGMKVYFRVRKDGETHWMTIDATGTGDSLKTAADLMALAQGWEFKIPPAQVQRMFKKRAELMETVEAEKPAQSKPEEKK